ncbi:MAG: ZIP family metal transporter [Amoebophilaceae bacterium]|jgi:zinc transporter ZupT|nr:ZIP family metal transporter [Amoebophilaceae bacterium]
MLFQALLIFLAAALGGSSLLIIRKPKPAYLKLFLIFSGGYLFAITFLHILPDLFALHTDARLAGLYILVGFFLQLLLEFFSKGIEHGHEYEAQLAEHRPSVSPLTLMAAFFLHAFLDGVILSSPSPAHGHHHHGHGANGLLIGILLHKIPESFVLASILGKLTNRKRTVIVCLLIFALASPMGLLGIGHFNQQQLLSGHGSLALWGIVSGSFMHIASTILAEASPCHRPNVRKFIASLLGAGLAVICEFVL